MAHFTLLLIGDVTPDVKRMLPRPIDDTYEFIEYTFPILEGRLLPAAAAVIICVDLSKRKEVSTVGQEILAVHSALQGSSFPLVYIVGTHARKEVGGYSDQLGQKISELPINAAFFKGDQPGLSACSNQLALDLAQSATNDAPFSTGEKPPRGRRVSLWTVLGGLVGAGVGAGLTVQFGIAAGVLFGALALSSPAGIAALAALIVGYFIVSALVTWVVARDKPQPGLQSGMVRIELKDLYPDEVMARFDSNKDDANLTPTHHIPAEQIPPRTDTTVTRRPSSAEADEQQPGSRSVPPSPRGSESK